MELWWSHLPIAAVAVALAAASVLWYLMHREALEPRPRDIAPPKPKRRGQNKKRR